MCRKAENWREAMQQRQKFWSRTHGFQFGRKLGDWSLADRAGSEPHQSGGPHDFVDLRDGSDSDDAELQQAIHDSMESMAPHPGMRPCES